MTVTRQELLDEITAEQAKLNEDSADIVLQIANLRAQLRRMNLQYRQLEKQRKAIEKNVPV